MVTFSLSALVQQPQVDSCYLTPPNVLRPTEKNTAHFGKFVIAYFVRTRAAESNISKTSTTQPWSVLLRAVCTKPYLNIIMFCWYFFFTLQWYQCRFTAQPSHVNHTPLQSIKWLRDYLPTWNHLCLHFRQCDLTAGQTKESWTVWCYQGVRVWYYQLLHTDCLFIRSEGKA